MVPHENVNAIVSHFVAAWMKWRKHFCTDTASPAVTDARNNENRPATFFETSTIAFNRDEWIPHSVSLPTLFIYAQRETDSQAASDSRREVKTKLQDDKASLVTMVLDWERSGNGGGMVWSVLPMIRILGGPICSESDRATSAALPPMVIRPATNDPSWFLSIHK